MRSESILLLLSLALAPAASAGEVGGSAIRVIDGDTVEAGGVHYRLRGWDAPEIFRPKCIGERRKGQAATARLRVLIDAAETVRIDSAGEEDFYRRTPADLVIDGVDSGAMLARDGLAKPSPDGRRQDWCTKIWPSRADQG